MEEPVQKHIVYSPSFLELHALAGESCQPRSPSWLYSMTDAMGLGEQSSLLDIGCGYGGDTVALVARHGLKAVAVDHLELMLSRTAAAVAEAGYTGNVEIRKGSIEDIPASDNEFDAIWCRDVLTVVPDLPKALRECARVLRPSRSMIVVLSYATELLSSSEAHALNRPLGHYESSMNRTYVEQAFEIAGFSIEDHDITGSEFFEWHEEAQDGEHPSQDLLKLSRLRRNKKELTATFGVATYAAVLSSCLWSVYTMLGKLESHLYVLRRLD